MSYNLIDVQSPDLPFTSPLPGGLTSEDELQLSVELEPESCLFIALKSSNTDHGSQIPFSFSLTKGRDELECQYGQNNIWEKPLEPTKTFVIEGIIHMYLSAKNNMYEVSFERSNNMFISTVFIREYSPFEADTLEIGISKGSGIVKCISLLRAMRWLKAGIDSPTPELAFKCGKDELNNDLYLGYSGNWEYIFHLVSVNPARKMAIMIKDGRELPVKNYELLEDNGFYVWTLYDGADGVEYAINVQEGSPIYIGRVAYEGALIAGTIKNWILSIHFKGKEIEIDSGYEVLCASPPLEILNKLQNEGWKKPPTEAIPTVDYCVICHTEEMTTSLNPMWAFWILRALCQRGFGTD